MTYTHINDTDKTVKTLATEPLGFGENDYYHNDIKACAEKLHALKAYDAWIYWTQWSSGTCLFKSPDGEKSITVNPTTKEVS